VINISSLVLVFGFEKNQNLFLLNFEILSFNELLSQKAVQRYIFLGKREDFFYANYDFLKT